MNKRRFWQPSPAWCYFCPLSLKMATPWRAETGLQRIPRSTVLPLAPDLNNSLSFKLVEDPAILARDFSPNVDPLPHSCTSSNKSFPDLYFLVWKWGGRVCGRCRWKLSPKFQVLGYRCTYPKKRTIGALFWIMNQSPSKRIEILSDTEMPR